MIETENHGTYFAVVNVGLKEKTNVSIDFPASGKVVDSATGKIVDANSLPDGATRIGLSFYPCELKTFCIK